MSDWEDWEDASAQCDRIVDMIDELDSRTLDKAADFFESVRGKVSAMQETIDRMKQISPKQRQALDNMEDGVSKWVR